MSCVCCFDRLNTHCVSPTHTYMPGLKVNIFVFSFLIIMIDLNYLKLLGFFSAVTLSVRLLKLIPRNV